MWYNFNIKFERTIAMKKYSRLIAAVMCVLLLAGCAKKPVTPTGDAQGEQQQQQATESTPKGTKNSLTGLYNLETADKAKLRPVAMSVNNQDGTRCCQIGLAKADIVYETYVEGGITRTLAVYKDITKAGEIGSIRSARYDFVDLACSNDAIYVHAGIDPTYCQPYVRKLGLDNINMLENRYYGYGYRPENGHIAEHTYYTTGEKVAKMLSEQGKRTTVKDDYSADWQKFNTEAKALSGGAATSIKVTFSSQYVDNFKYDTAKKAYIKENHAANQKHSPRYPDEVLAFENVVVLFTSLGDMGNNYRVDVGLKSGSGYYFSNGTYQEIKWEKGTTYDKLKFKDADGNPLAYNPGKSWVCIVSNDMKGRFSYE